MPVSSSTDPSDVAKQKVLQEQKCEKDALTYQEAILDIINDAIVTTDNNFIIKSWNASAERIYGWTSKEAIGKQANDLFKTDFTDKHAITFFEELIKTGFIHQEVIHTRKDGSKLTVDAIISAIKDSSGKITGTVGVFRDMTRRKQAEIELKESEEKYRRLFTNLFNGFAYHKMLFDKDERPIDYVFLEINDAFSRITGLERDIIGKKVTEVIPNIEKDATNWIDIYGKVASTGQPIKFESYSTQLQKWFLISAYSPQRGYFATIFEDITDRKKIEEAQKANEERLNMAQRMGRMGSWEFNIKDNKALWSEELFRIFKLDKQRYGPDVEAYRKLIHPEDLDYVTKIVVPFTIEGHLGDRVSFDYRIVLGDGSVRVLHTERIIKEVDESGKPLKILGIEQDITERKRIELELEQYNKHLEQLVEERTNQLQDKERLATIGATAGMVGHDIRNPLQSIMSSLYIIQTALDKMKQSEERQDALFELDSIREQIGYIDKIVADLHDYARPLKPRIVTVDLKNFVDNLLSNLVVPANIRVSTTFEQAMSEVKTDPVLLKRILTNLIVNAIQAMPNGGKVSINVRQNKKSGNIVIDVEDTGIGMSKEVQEKLFTPLFTTKSKGQGFGLAVVKRLIEVLGGTITFESEVNKGTKFTVSLPVQES